MKYRTHWHFKDEKNKGGEKAVDCSIDQIIELARELKDDDVDLHLPSQLYGAWSTSCYLGNSIRKSMY